MSERKLKGLLAPTTRQPKEPSHPTISAKKSASPSPSPTIAPNSHKSTPICENNLLDVKPHGTPMYYEIPGVHNFFYNPISKSETDVQPSPWLGPFKLKGLKNLPPGCIASAQTAASNGDHSRNPSQIDNDCSNSLYSVVKKLNLQFGSQPKNLEELLQRSFASMPSHSMMQSPHVSVMPSPFIRSHTSTLLHQGLPPGSVSDLSFKGSFVQKSPFSASQSFKHKMTPATDDGLIMQIASLINKESDGRIKGAIIDLIAQYNSNAQQKDGGQNGLLLGENITGVAEGIADIMKPKTISLSNGMKMNAVNRSPKASSSTGPSSFKPNPQNTKVEAARKELFVISEFSEKSQSVPVKPPETNEINLFNFTTNPSQLTSRDASSPLISSTLVLKDGLGLMSQSHSLVGQTLSLNGPAKKSPFELTGKFQVNNAFKLSTNLNLQTKPGENNVGELNGNNKQLDDKSKSRISKSGKTRTKGRKGKKVTVEDYVKHVEDSNMTIEGTWEDGESWNDIGTPGRKKKN